MVEVGDKVLVFAAGSDYATAVPLSTPAIGDKVALYNLKDETRIAVPTLWFSIGDFAFVTPNFDFAGFDFKLDFNMQLIPLDLSFIGGDTTFIWNQVEYQSDWVNWGGYGQIWLTKSGDFVRKTVPYDYQYCAFKFDGDFNDGVAGIYINDILVDSVCMYNAGIRWYTYDRWDIGGSGIHKLEVKYTGINCGGTLPTLAWIKFAFYNDPDYVLD